MEVLYKFDPMEDSFNLKCTEKATDLALALWDFDQELRSKIKYANLPEHECTVYERIREKLNDILADKGIDLDVLIV